MQLKKCKTKQYDKAREALQAPISAPAYKVIWLANGKESHLGFTKRSMPNTRYHLSKQSMESKTRSFMLINF